MITAALLVPHPPLLFRELGGLADPVADLRRACNGSLRDALADDPDVAVVVGGADVGGTWTRADAFDVRRFGTTHARTGSDLPLSVGVGRRLLDEAGWEGPTELVTLPWDVGAEHLERLHGDLSARPERLLVLLLGEGSARRGEKAPGFLDERAFGFDDLVAAALDTGDATALRDLDTALAEELMVTGRPVLRLLGLLGAPVRAEVSYRDDPFGVSYFVARWQQPSEGTVSASR